MAKLNKRRKIIIFSLIGLVLVAVTLVVIFKKREPVITVQTEKVARHSLTNIVIANGKIQPVIQVTISPEVSGEITELPVKEGQQIKRGDLLVKIKPDVYIAAVNQAKAGYESSLAAKISAQASLEKAEADYKRNLELFNGKLLSESDYIGFKAARDVARAQLDSANGGVNVAKASVDSAEEELAKTTIVSPLDGTISKLNSQLGERVLGTVQNAGTIIMIISDLNEIEARVDVGEMDVVGIKPGQKARLEVDAFKDRKFGGAVTDVASSSKDSNLPAGYSSSSGSSQSQEATKFQVRIRLNDKEDFRPGMSVSADIETEYRTNVLTVPLASVTTRLPKPVEKKNSPGTNGVKSGVTNMASATAAVAADKKSKESSKMSDVVFAVNGNHVDAMPVKIGICDDSYWEITDGLTNGEEIVSGGYRAISRDLDDGKKIKKGPATTEPVKKD